jgi:hypothetical protein
MLLTGLIFYSTRSDEDTQVPVTTSDLNIDKKELKQEMVTSMGQIAANIASPAEIAASIKNAGGTFSQNILLNTDVAKYLTPKEKALAMGGIGADLVYINLFEKRSATIAPLNQIRKLSNELYLSQFFDFEILKNIATASLSKEDIDSLVLLTTVRLNSMEQHMLTPERAETGIFVVIGAWAESLYLLTHYANKYQVPEIREKVAEQQLCLEELLKWLDKFQEIKEVNEVLEAMDPLKKHFCSVQIKYENTGSPIKTVDINGKSAMYQPQKSIAIIDSRQVEGIASESEKFRNKMFRLIN